MSYHRIHAYQDRQRISEDSCSDIMQKCACCSSEIRPTRMLATHAHAFALPRMQRAQRACSAKDVGGRVGREKPVQAIAANRQRVVSCKRTRDSGRGISEQSGGQCWATCSGQRPTGSRQQAMVCRQQAAGSAHHASGSDDARLLVRSPLLARVAEHVDHPPDTHRRSCRPARHRRILREEWAAGSEMARARVARKRRTVQQRAGQGCSGQQ